MTRILIIDDEPIFHKMIMHALKPLGADFDTASDGQQGIYAAGIIPPDMIICDVNMPKMSGYEVTRHLRRNPRFAHTPILILTAQSDLEEKLEAFKAGADDHVTKPFAPAELLARVEILLRRGEQLRGLQAENLSSPAHLIAVHSLRGGMGCTSLATNLAVGLAGLWKSKTMLLDLVLMGGQVALMLNSSLKHAWADLGSIKPDELDFEALQNIILNHESGVDFIAAPTYPAEAELLTPDLFSSALKILKTKYEYIVADLPGDFSEITVRVMDEANIIVLMLAPEMASVRAAMSAMDTYQKLGYPQDKIKLVLNWVFERRGLARRNIEAALHHPIDLEIPYNSDLMIESINYGQPFLLKKPNEPISILVENLAYRLSREEQRKNPPAVQTQAWQRVNRRMKA